MMSDSLIEDVDRLRLIGGREFQSCGSLLKYKCCVKLVLEREGFSFRCVMERVLVSEKCTSSWSDEGLVVSVDFKQQMNIQF